MRSFFREHLRPATLLLAISLLPRLWVASQAVAPNKDAIRYWAAADLFVLHSPIDAIRSLDSLPVYPAILALIKLVGWASTPELWWRSSQLAGVVAYAIFLLSAYAAGSMMFGRQRAWWGCLLVSLLPRQIRYSVDILADNLLAAFLWMALALWWWTMNRSGRMGWLLLTSTLLGLAALTRPEAYLWIGVLSILTVLSGNRKEEGKESLVMVMTLLLVPLIVIVGSYSLIRGEIAPSNTARAMLGVTTASEVAVDVDSKTLFDTWIAASPNLWSSMAGVALVVICEGAQETRVLLLLFLLVGLVGGGLGTGSSRWLMVLLLVGTMMMLFWCRWKAGFLSSRYFMPILPIIGFGAVTGLDMLIEKLGRLAPRVVVSRWAYSGAVVVALVLAVPTLSEPMHEDRSGHRQAADWLLAHTPAGEAVFDPSWVSAYFSGRPMTIPSSDSIPRYAVIDASYAQSPPGGLKSAIEFALSGREVVEFAKRPGSSVIGIRVYELPRQAEAQGDSAKFR